MISLGDLPTPEKMILKRRTGLQRALHLAAGDNIHAAPEAGEQLKDGKIPVSLHRITNRCTDRRKRRRQFFIGLRYDGA